MSVIWTLNLRHLQVMTAVADMKNVSAAAAAINLTQPAVTKALAGLEKKLNCKLFDRMTDGMQPTESAGFLTARVRRALALLSSRKISLNHMRALIELTEAGSYKLAQAHTGLAASTLHRSVNHLEALLEISLVRKIGNRVVLTEPGRKLYKRFKLAKAELETGIWEAQGAQGVMSGRIKVGAMPLSRAKILPQAIAGFYNAYPDVHVSVMEGSRAELYEHLLNGDLDMLVGALRPADEAGPVVQQLLFRDSPMIVARKNHPLAMQGSLTVDDCRSFPWIVSAEGTPIRRLWDELFHGGDVPAAPVECSSIMMIRELLLQNDFLALASKEQLSAELALDWLTILPLVGFSDVRPIGLTTRQDWFPSAVQKDFVRFLEGACSL